MYKNQPAKQATINSEHYRTMLDDKDNVYLWQARSYDAAGRLTSHITGNALISEHNYNQATGQLDTIKSGFSYAEQIRDLSYQYDKLNNVTNRTNHQNNLKESFSYDMLDRIKQSNTTGKIGLTEYNNIINYQYDIRGNITYKSDTGDYNYNNATAKQPHTPQSITGITNRTYQYDNNGNMTSNDNKSITWTSFNKPKSFKTNTDTTTFNYAPNRARYQKTQTGTSYKQTIYLDKTYEHITEQDKTHQKNYIYVNKQLISIHTKTTLITDKPVLKQITQTRYLHYDNLGSIDTITDGKGNIVERMSYTSFGDRRQGDWRANQNNNTTTNYTNELLAKFTNRGYTGHEHIDEMNLIHMNGRVYDPQIGRFLSADPIIQHPYKSQSYNRYSYVLNNPHKYTDPSGFCDDSDGDGDDDGDGFGDDSGYDYGGEWNDFDDGGYDDTTDGYGVGHSDYETGDYGDTGGNYGSQYNGGETNSHGNVVPSWVSRAGTPLNIQLNKRLSYEFRQSIIEAKKIGKAWDTEGYIDRLKSGGIWDFKSRDLYKDMKGIEAFSNFAYGATSASFASGFSFGISEHAPDLTTNIAGRLAGHYQENNQSYDPANGSWNDIESPGT